MLVEAHIASNSKKYCGENTLKAKLFGTTTEVTIQGKATFKHLSAFCAPGGYVNVTFISTMASNNVLGFPNYKGISSSGTGGISSNAATVGSSQTAGKNQIVQSDVKFQFRECHRGEIFTSDDSAGISACQLCSGGYSFMDNRDNTVFKCNPCPKGAFACFGSSIILEQDTFRWNEEASTVFSCPLANACKGGNVTGENLCHEGYTGARCGVCQADYFRSSLTNECASCKGTASYTLGLMVAVLLLCILIGLLLRYYKEPLEKLLNGLFERAFNCRDYSRNEVHPAPPPPPAWAPEYLRMQEQKQEAEVAKKRKEQLLALSARFKMVVSTMQIISSSK